MAEPTEADRERAEERERARAPFLALVAEEQAYVDEIDSYEITVLIPNKAGRELIDRVFEAVAVAVDEAVPDERDWDPFVAGCGPFHGGVPLHLLRRAAEETGQ